MSSIISQLPTANGSRLTGRNYVLNKDTNFFNSYQEDVMHRLDTTENTSGNLKRNGIGRLCNVDCMQQSSHQMLCKQWVIKNRSSELHILDDQLDSTLSGIKIHGNTPL